MTNNHNVYRHVVIWFLVLLFAIGISLFVGSTGITWKFDNQLEWTIFYKLRVPRTLLALIAGMGLVMSGQIYQTILNNPLADSFTLGLAGQHSEVHLPYLSAYPFGLCHYFQYSSAC